MTPQDRSELTPLLKAGSESIIRANRAASSVLTVVGALNTANASFLRTSSVRSTVETRLAASYQAQCEPLETAAEALEREMAILTPAHARIRAALHGDAAASSLAKGYLASIAKLSASAILATAELTSLPSALDQLGERMPPLQRSTARLAPAIRRALLALSPATAWGDP